MVHSSVMSGKVLTRLDYAGNKWKTDFNVEGLLMAVQWGVSYASSSASIQWTHVAPQGLSEAGDANDERMLVSRLHERCVVGWSSLPDFQWGR
jgi:hypothetical protein